MEHIATTSNIYYNPRNSIGCQEETQPTDELLIPKFLTLDCLAWFYRLLTGFMKAVTFATVRCGDYPVGNGGVF